MAEGIVKIFGIVCVIFVFGMFVLGGLFYIIDSGERGVLLTWGSVDPNPRMPGLGFKIPIMQSLVKMEVRTQKYEADASAASKDLQIVTAKITTNFHLSESDVPKIYTELGTGYADRLIQPLEQEIVKAIISKYTAEELITRREDVRQEIKQLFTERLGQRGIIVEEVSIVNFDFSQSFNEAIELKVTAEQNALAAKNKLEQVKFEAQQVVEQANGKAQAITIESNALKSNPAIIQMRYIEKWDGKMSLVTGGATPLIQIPVMS